MKKYFLFLSLLSVAFIACKKTSTNSCSYTAATAVASQSEIAKIDSVFEADGITTAVQEPTGVFYTLDSAGTGAQASGLCSQLVVTYKGYVLGRTAVFDSVIVSTGAALELGALIAGWQYVLPSIKSGSKITLYVPPSLGYGSVNKKNGDGDIVIPANSYLIFKIDLLSVR